MYVAVGGALGSVARYLVSKWIADNISSAMPWGTMAVNLLGCLLIGVFCGLADKFGIGGEIKLLLTVGFCGGFTTFSTFMNENLSLLRSSDLLLCALYTGGSVALGLLCVFLGRMAFMR